MSITASRKTRRVLVVTAGTCEAPIPAAVLTEAGIEWMVRCPVEAAEFLRSEPFTVTAVVVAANGALAGAHDLVAELKAAAPRSPIVFLDESNSPASEVGIRRMGVHYYAHIPVSPDEISAVLDGLSSFRSHERFLAVRPAS